MLLFKLDSFRIQYAKLGTGLVSGLIFVKKELYARQEIEKIEEKIVFANSYPVPCITIHVVLLCVSVFLHSVCEPSVYLLSL